MQAAYTDSAANVKRMSFLSLACRAFNVYNNCMVRLIFTAGRRLLPPVPCNPSLFRPFRRCCIPALSSAKTIQEDIAMIAR
jgi:hypothetical protein